MACQLWPDLRRRPELGTDTDAVLREVLDLSPDPIAALRRSGAFG
jgi:crotonobetainyl-CoA:carnitine CoA-transferase CaiB-like acyl-CoA transferase